METTELAFSTQMNTYSINRAGSWGTLTSCWDRSAGSWGSRVLEDPLRPQPFTCMISYSQTHTPHPPRDGPSHPPCMGEMTVQSHAGTRSEPEADRNPRGSGRTCRLLLQPKP